MRLGVDVITLLSNLFFENKRLKWLFSTFSNSTQNGQFSTIDSLIQRFHVETNASYDAADKPPRWSGRSPAQPGTAPFAG